MILVVLAGCFPTWEPFPDVTVPTDADGDADSDGDIDGDGDLDGDAEVEVDADSVVDADEAVDADEEQLDDADLDVEAEEDSDIDLDIVEESPRITGIDGTGLSQAIEPRPEDLEEWTAHTEDRMAADHRIDSTAPMLVVAGENLTGTTDAHVDGLEGQGRIDFSFEEVTVTEVRLRFPSALSVASGGLFLLTLATPLGEARAELFFLQGEPGTPGSDGTNGEPGAAGERGPQGDPGPTPYECDGDGNCTLSGDLTVEGDLTSAGSISGVDATFDTLEVNELTVLMSVWLPECPQGYERDDSREDIILCTNGRDEMVKVGDFWVDRYEASVWSDAACSVTQYGGASDNYPVTFPDSGQVRAAENRLYACSRSGVTPSRYLTWFQAQTACAASGKSLITNAEWQMAVAGTNDPGASSVDAGLCLTSGAGARPTGRAGRNPCGGDSCVSLWGAEDMIGNLLEWTSDWWQAGRGWDAGFSDGAYADVWPDGYSSDNDDRTWNLDGRAAGPAGWANGLPAAAVRGGYWTNGTQAGAFALYVYHAPSHSSSDIGFRCAAR